MKKKNLFSIIHFDHFNLNVVDEMRHMETEAAAVHVCFKQHKNVILK